jgi:hypothetical protein
MVDVKCVQIPVDAFTRSRGRRKRDEPTTPVCVRMADGVVVAVRVYVMQHGGSVSEFLERAATECLARVGGGK